MTPEQALNELRKELAVNSRIADLVKRVAADSATEFFRRTSQTIEHGLLIKLTSEAGATTKFADSITKPPVAAAKLRQ